MPIASARVALGMLRQNPLRTALSTLGVVIGVGSLVSVLALGDGFEQAMRRMADEDGRLQTVGVVAQTYDEIQGVRVPRKDIVAFTHADADSLAARLEAAGARVAVGLTVDGLARLGDEAWARRAGLRGVALLATTVPTRTGFRTPLAAGRYFTEGEARAAAPLVVVSDSLARALAGAPAAALGTELRLESLPVRVVGVMARQESDARRPVHAVVPLGVAAAAMAPATVPRVPAFRLRAERVEDVLPAKRTADAWLAARLGPAWKERAQVQSYEREAERGEQAILMFKLFMGAITGISLVVGGIGIMNIMLVSVTERTREIGIRRAVGARRRDILVQFLAESVTISGAGSAVGTVLGVAVAALVAAQMRRMTLTTVSPGFSAGTFVVIAAAALGVGLVFGTYPALRAARLSPIDALRHE